MEFFGYVKSLTSGSREKHSTFVSNSKYVFDLRKTSGSCMDIEIVANSVSMAENMKSSSSNFNGFKSISEEHLAVENENTTSSLFNQSDGDISKTEDMDQSIRSFDVEENADIRIRNSEADENLLFHNNVSLINSKSDFEPYKPPIGHGITYDSDLKAIKSTKTLDILACQVSMHGWSEGTNIDRYVARRLRDFQFARMKRYKHYGQFTPGGIHSLYDHLRSIKMDVAWVEEVSRRRLNAEHYLNWVDYDEIIQNDLQSKRPYFTYVLVIALTTVLLVSIVENNLVLEDFKMNPLIGPSSSTLLKMGAKETNLIINGEGWRLLTSIFLSGGLVHLALNLTIIAFMGSAFEQFHGSKFTAGTFIVTGVAGMLASALFIPHSVAAGASGGVLGILGACLYDIKLNWFHLCCFHGTDLFTVNMNFVLKALLNILLILAVTFFLGLMPNQDNFTNLASIIYGFLFGMTFMTEFSMDFEIDRNQKLISSKDLHTKFGTLSILVFGILTSAFLVFSNKAESLCVACENVACITFPSEVKIKSNKWWYCDPCDNTTADVMYDERTGLPNKLVLHCPHGDSVNVYSDAILNDDMWFDNKLPDLCRQHCEVN